MDKLKVFNIREAMTGRWLQPRAELKWYIQNHTYYFALDLCLEDLVANLGSSVLCDKLECIAFAPGIGELYLIVYFTEVSISITHGARNVITANTNVIIHAGVESFIKYLESLNESN